MSTISHGTVTVRKPHHCCFCGLHIAKGQQAVRHVYRDDGICTSYAHEDCQAATEWAKWDWCDYDSHTDHVEFRNHPLAAYLQHKATTPPPEKGGA